MSIATIAFQPVFLQNGLSNYLKWMHEDLASSRAIQKHVPDDDGDWRELLSRSLDSKSLFRTA